MSVDLTLKGGEIIDDGMGNTETATLIEGILGSAMDDTIKGDAAANYLGGFDGKDTMAGCGGADYFVFGFFNSNSNSNSNINININSNSNGEFGDTILDFKSGTDHIVLTHIATNFAVLDAIRFSNGAVAGSANKTCFFFDAASHKLFMDSDAANEAAGAVEIAKLTGITAMSSTDIISVDYFDFWG